MSPKKSSDLTKDRNKSGKSAGKPAGKKERIGFRVTAELENAIKATASRLKIKPAKLCTDILSRAVELMTKGKTLEELFTDKTDNTDTKKPSDKLSTPGNASKKKASATKSVSLAAGSDSATKIVYAKSGAEPSDILKAQLEIQDAGDNVRIVFEDGEYEEDEEKNKEVITSLKGQYRVKTIKR